MVELWQPYSMNFWLLTELSHSEALRVTQKLHEVNGSVALTNNYQTGWIFVYLRAKFLYVC